MTVELALYLLFGLALGAAYFAAAWHTVRRFAGGAGAAGVAGLAVLRLAVAAIAFWWAARHGAGPLLAAFAGFLLARFAATRLLREAR